jgi:hypothetical protein
MARSGCIVKALMFVSVLAGLTGKSTFAQAQAAPPVPTVPPRSAAAPTPAQPPATKLVPPTKAAPVTVPPAAPSTATPATPAPSTPVPSGAPATPAAAPGNAAETNPGATTAPAAESGETASVDAGAVAAPVVQAPHAIPAPPPDRYAFPTERPLEVCPPGRCGDDCRHRCAGYRTCLSDGTCDTKESDLGQDHKGLLLRVTTGWGFGRLSASEGNLHEPSFVIGLGVDVGTAVIENLIVRGRVRGAAGYYSEGDFGNDVLFSFGGVGAGVDYYFMPVNIYVGGTISIAGIARADEDNSHRSKAGLGLDLDVGKEWWVGRRWGIGIALRASYIDVASANILHDPSARLRSFHAGLQLSATFN